MTQRLNTLITDFPRQFWILFGGTLINATGNGMVFPFLTLYLHQKLNISMTMVGVILLIWSSSSLVGQIVGGALTDKLGRKRLMSFSLGANALVLVGFAFADTFLFGAIVAMLSGFIGALFQPARDAMIADMVPADKRTQAYSLLRVVANLGIAIGPAIGGFLAAQSYTFIFLANASTAFSFCLLTIFFMHETKPMLVAAHHTNETAPGNFLTLLRDTRFLIFCSAIALCTILAGQMMAVLPIYMKDQFGLGETFYGWVMTTNAGMVVLLQLPIMRMTQRIPRLYLTTAGALLFGLGVFSVAYASEFPHFVAAMIVYTFGEMLLVPTSNAVTADLAPADMRGRYMGMLGLTWSIGFGVGPIIGGLIGDQLGASAIWMITATSGFLSAFVFLLLQRFAPVQVRLAQG
ncbi:MAG: MFS transporter [Chloroflexi bacterium]|nr:MFS transporter [Chloroflexota bacterium]